MKKAVIWMLVVSMLLGGVSCQSQNSEGEEKNTVEATLEEGMNEKFGDLYDGIETGILVDGSDSAYWKLNGDTLTLFGEGDIISTAASFFPWKNFHPKVKKLDILSGVTWLSSYALYGFDELVEINIADGCFVGTGMGCFGSAKNLKKVNLGNSLEKIASETFINCAALEEISIPATVTNIGYAAFDGCDSLKTVYYGGSEEDWNEIIIDKGNDVLEKVEIIFNN